MWVLVWLQVVAGMPLGFFQLGTYESRTICDQYRQKAEVMVINTNISVNCLQVLVND
jgi:hypothetical protein|tara:strand:- start:40 stop:210 length:171 start_codon:yes stop_codon:yes gene_type:complete